MVQKGTRALSLLLPGRLHTFSAARYMAGDNIAPHDDKAYADVSNSKKT
jgi:hypothetical protein